MSDAVPIHNAIALTRQIGARHHAHHPQPFPPGATQEQIMEAIRVGAEMRAGAAFAHSIKAKDLMQGDAAG